MRENFPGPSRVDPRVIPVAVGFADRLRACGIPLCPDQIVTFVQAVEVIDPARLADLYWTARVTLVTRHDDITLFERIFNDVFRGLEDVTPARGDPNTTPSPGRPSPPVPHGRGQQQDTARSSTGGDLAVSPTSDGRPSDGAEERAALVAAFSSEERLATTDFGVLTDEELGGLYRLMATLRIALPTRPGRRQRRHARGDRLDLRATLRQSRRSAGEPFHHITRRARQRCRKLVVLCDVSGSMSPYSRAFVQLLHAAHGASRGEVFTFATRLTRVTRAFSEKRPDAALARLAAAVPDWRGGTRLGDAMKEFIDGYGRRGVARGAVVVIVSDGWDSGAPEVLAEQMQRLRRLAHRTVWVNPRSAAPGFEPLARGMAAALPFCDAVVSGHSLASMGQLLDALNPKQTAEAGRKLTIPVR